MTKEEIEARLQAIPTAMDELHALMHCYLPDGSTWKLDPAPLAQITITTDEGFERSAEYEELRVHLPVTVRVVVLVHPD